MTYLSSMDNFSLSRTAFEIFDFKVSRVWPATFDTWSSSGVKKDYAIRKVIYEFLFDFYEQHLCFIVPFSRYSTSKFSGFDPDLWPLMVIWGQKKLYNSKAHKWLPIWLLWTTSLYLLPLSRYSTSKFSGFDFDLWPLKDIWCQKKCIPFESPCMISYWTSMNNISLLVPFSRYSNSIFLGFDLDLWPLKIIWGRNLSYHSKAHMWLPIWLLWTTSLYLVPFQRYSTSKFLRFDLDLWPLKVIWGEKNSYYSKAHIWLPVWLLWTTSLYLVPFSRYSTSKFLGFDLDLWPLKVIWGQKNYTIRMPMYDFLFDLYGQHLCISYLLSRYSTSKFSG